MTTMHDERIEGLLRSISVNTDRIAEALERIAGMIDAVTGIDDHRRKFIRTWDKSRNE